MAFADVEVTLIDRRNIQALSYQVATGALSSAEVCFPLRWILRRRKDVRLLIAEVMDVDLDRRAVRVRPVAEVNEPILLRYRVRAHPPTCGTDEVRPSPPACR